MMGRLALKTQAELAENERACLALNAKYRSWICDERRMRLAKSSAIYMHCLPADRGTKSPTPS
jgi:ornithine carbamoyltransferase